MPDLYQPTWSSLSNWRCPEWFRDAKFGIFTHWGPYCVPAYRSEKYPRFMYEPGNPTRAHHEAQWGPLREFGYKDFIPLFIAPAFDPAAWVETFRAAGARYYVPVAEHHDGFPMYDCPYTEWKATTMGPRRDVIAELERAARAAGLRFGVSTHRANHWRYYRYDDDLDTVHPENAGLYGAVHDRSVAPDQAFLEDWWRRTTDLVERFRPDMLYFDFFSDRPAFRPYHPRMAAYLYNHAATHGYEAVLADKNFEHPAYPPETIVLDFERGKADAIRDIPWQTDTALGVDTWCHTTDQELKSAATVIHELIDIVSKNGNLMLNVGPDAAGEIPADQRAVLRGIGDWLAVNGDAIYGTRPWITYGEGETPAPQGHHSESAESPYRGEDLRFTTDNRHLYAITLGVPAADRVVMRSLGLDDGHRVIAVQLLGCDGDIGWTQHDDALVVSLPSTPPNAVALTFRLTLAGYGASDAMIAGRELQLAEGG